MVDGTAAERVECARNIAVGKRSIQLFRRPLGGRSALQPRKHARKESVVRARRIDGLDVDRRERVPLSLKTPFAALPPSVTQTSFSGKPET